LSKPKGTARLKGSIGVLRKGNDHHHHHHQQQQHSLFSQASWGRLEMKPERNKFKERK